MKDSSTSGVPWFTAPAALTLFTCVGAARTDRPLAIVLGLGITVLATSAVLASRKVDGWRLVAGLAIAAAAVVLACYGDPRNVGWFGVCVIVGWAALAAAPRVGVSAGVAAGAVFAYQFAMVSAEPG